MAFSLDQVYFLGNLYILKSLKRPMLLLWLVYPIGYNQQGNLCWVLVAWSVASKFPEAMSFQCPLRSGVDSIKFPAMVLAWESLQEVFVMLVVVVVFTSLEVFHSLLFDVIPHFWTFPSHFYRECYGFERAFFTQRRFLPYIPSFVTQMRAGTPYAGSSLAPALTELSLLAGAWT